MEWVRSIAEIQNNMKVLDGYLDKKHEPEYSFSLCLLKKGICFIAVHTKKGYRFYPSRFIGYANNDMNKYLENEEKNGIDTNRAIVKVLNQKAVFDLTLEKAYQEYCAQLGFVANERGAFGAIRKYWSL